MGQKQRPAPSRILLVQSNIVIGLDIADDLERHRYEVVGPMPCAAAVEWLQRDRPDMAVLDVDLQAGPCLDLVRDLRACAVPLLVLSCHEQRHALTEFRDLPWLPILGSRGALHSTLRKLSPRRAGERAR